jgi:hypothetical protein
MPDRIDETWHRLREWTYGQAQSERLAGQVLIAEGYTGFDPSHPLGGPDGGRDGMATKDGQRLVMAVYFPRGQQGLNAIRAKFATDLDGVASNNADGIVFVTNQELTLSERRELVESTDSRVDLYHLVPRSVRARPRLRFVRACSVPLARALPFSLSPHSVMSRRQGSAPGAGQNPRGRHRETEGHRGGGKARRGRDAGRPAPPGNGGTRRRGLGRDSRALHCPYRTTGIPLPGLLVTSPGDLAGHCS